MMRHYFGIAAASLQNQLDDPKYKQFNPNIKLISAGIDGEKKTSQILREWIADKPDCILIDSISLPIEEKMEPEIDGEEGQLDLVIQTICLLLAQLLLSLTQRTGNQELLINLMMMVLFYAQVKSSLVIDLE